MNSRDHKLRLARLKMKARDAVQVALSKRESDDLATAIDTVVRELEAASFREVADLTEKQQAQLEGIQRTLESVRDGLAKGMPMTNADDIVEAISKLELSPIFNPKIEVKQVELPRDLATNKAIAQVAERVDKLAKLLDKTLGKALEQARVGYDPANRPPERWTNVRRVVKRGNTYMYDDADWSGGGSGGASAPSPSIEHVVIDQSGAGTDTLVNAISGKRIRVINYVVTVSASATVKFTSNDTAITGAMPVSAGISAEGSSTSALFSTHDGEALKIITTSAAGKGHLSYYIE